MFVCFSASLCSFNVSESSIKLLEIHDGTFPCISFEYSSREFFKINVKFVNEACFYVMYVFHMVGIFLYKKFKVIFELHIK